MRAEGPTTGPERLPVAELFRVAHMELAGDEWESPLPWLVALHERPVREVFDGAAVRLSRGDPAERELGARVLRELGPADEDGRRPFTADAVPLLVDRLRREADPGVLQWVISALGYNGAREALPEILPFAWHPDRRVRFHVATAIPSLVDCRRIDTPSLAVLVRLSGDDDADIRYYALYAMLEELGGIDRRRLTRVIAARLTDPDDQIRHLARLHHKPSWEHEAERRAERRQPLAGAVTAARSRASAS